MYCVAVFLLYKISESACLDAVRYSQKRGSIATKEERANNYKFHRPINTEGVNTLTSCARDD